MLKAALFDLDGVVLDTENLYTRFWGGEARRYYPQDKDLEYRIKGQTLPVILSQYFGSLSEEEHQNIVKRLDEYEASMKYDYIAGAESFIKELRDRGVKTAIVTSSNLPKMNSVFSQRPELLSMFDAILTSEDFSESKPSPDCYLKAAARLGAQIDECVVFEDSVNGLLSGHRAEMYVVGLTTTNPQEIVAKYADVTIPDFLQLNVNTLIKHFV